MLPYKSQMCKLTSCYGYRIHPIHGWRHFHGGVDLVGISSEEIVAVTDGTVVRSRIVTNKNDATWEWGEYIAISGVDGKTIYYCHLAKRLVKVGAKVKAGDIIGIQGRTGQATGNHLHFEVRDGSKQINAAEYIGIKNAAGRYNGVYVAINVLVEHGVINSPAYWKDICYNVRYLDELLVKTAAYISARGCKASSKPLAFEAALGRLHAVGIINTPEYWRGVANKVQYLPDLICKLGGAV